MLQLLNTLYVMSQGAYLRLDHDTVRVELDGETRLRAPLLHLGGLVCMGDVRVSPYLIHRCAEDGRSLVLFSRTGRFKARIEGPTSGNVLLRRAQHAVLSDPTGAARVARAIVAGKLQTSRGVLLRAAREARAEAEAVALRDGAEALAVLLPALKLETDLERVRGIEGEAGRVYFELFDRMVREDREAFAFPRRSRRPPLDRMNALLSFLYALVRGDCAAALEGVGLDPQVGYLHALRPGRPALALDLMEEFRPVIADSVVLTLINNEALTRADFITWRDACNLTEGGRKAFFAAYEQRKATAVTHPVYGYRMTYSRMLAAFVRGEIPSYTGFTVR